MSHVTDLYLEGSDQHRAWFQASLLVSVMLFQQAPYQNVLTHGFILDERGDKISKSKGNEKMSLSEMIDFYGVDVLRLWVLSSDFTEDIKLSTTLLTTMQEKYRKFRNVLRYLIGNLKGFDFATQAQPYEKLSVLDRCLLHELFLLEKKRKENFAQMNFSGWVQYLYEWCCFKLSTVYFDTQKDALYCDAIEGQKRLNILTVFNEILNVLARLLAPITPFLVQELALYWHQGIVNFSAQDRRESLLNESDALPIKGYAAVCPQHWHNDAIALFLEEFLSYRSDILSVFETAREKKIVQDGLSAQLFLKSLKIEQFLQKYSLDLETLQEYLCFSQIQLNEQQLEGDDPDLLVSKDFSWGSVCVMKAEGVKCPRCRKRHQNIHADDLCQRCDEVMTTKV
jgi:isoleucyl-tRNA synthetase